MTRHLVVLSEFSYIVYMPPRIPCSACPVSWPYLNLGSSTSRSLGSWPETLHTYLECLHTVLCHLPALTAFWMPHPTVYSTAGRCTTCEMSLRATAITLAFWKYHHCLKFPTDDFFFNQTRPFAWVVAQIYNSALWMPDGGLPSPFLHLARLIPYSIYHQLLLILCLPCCWELSMALPLLTHMW